MSKQWLSFFNRKLGVDLGSSRIRIWNEQAGFVVDEPSCLAVDERTHKVLAVGSEALAMSGRVSDTIKVYHPIQHGVITDFDLARALLKVLLQKVFRSTAFFRPVIMVSLPGSVTAAQRERLVELIYAVGAREVYTINQSLAAAIGAGVPIADASGSFIMHAGSGVVEASIISLGSVVVHEAIWQAGEYADQKIQQHIKAESSLVISAASAEKLKKSIGSVLPLPDKSELAAGQDLVTLAPKEVLIEANQLQPTLQEIAIKYEHMIKKVLSTIPPELTVDVIDKGMLLSGGWSQVQGLDAYLISCLGIPVSVVEEPSQVTIKGIAAALENIELFKGSLGYVS